MSWDSVDELAKVNKKTTPDSTKDATKRPWKVIEDKTHKGIIVGFRLKDNKGESIHLGKANTDLIIKAVNRDHAFDALLEVAQGAWHWHCGSSWRNSKVKEEKKAWEEMRVKIDNALKLAKEEL